LVDTGAEQQTGRQRSEQQKFHQHVRVLLPYYAIRLNPGSRACVQPFWGGLVIHDPESFKQPNYWSPSYAERHRWGIGYVILLACHTYCGAHDRELANAVTRNFPALFLPAARARDQDVGTNGNIAELHRTLNFP
jgi:hypothetical protein